MHVLADSLFLFGLAVVFAVIEIEAEGKYGWAEKLPTWYRVNGTAAKIWNIANPRPLTGYHLAMLPLPIMIFLYPMVENSSLTFAGFFAGAAAYFAWLTVWDFCWFVLNPHYGVKRFRKENIWWFSKEPWLFRRIPFSYIASWTVSIAAAVVSGWIDGGALKSLGTHLGQLGIYLAVVAFLAVVVAPQFNRYYHAMRTKDERDQAGIFHPDEQSVN
jgi:hypothetical protein